MISPLAILQPIIEQYQQAYTKRYQQKQDEHHKESSTDIDSYVTSWMKFRLFKV